MEDDRPLSAKEKRQEQIKRWENSATDLECGTYSNPNIRVKFDDGAVFLAACSSGDLDEVKKLLKKGADINFANVDGLTALHQACIDGNLDVVKFLVENGSEIDQEDNEGWTPLHATASCGFMDIAKYLVQKGANVGAVNSEAELPIDIAEEDEMIEFLQSEIDRQGIDVHAARDIERLVMMQDANEVLGRYHGGGKLEVHRHPKSGATLLHIAAAKGYNDVLQILIKAGYDVNLRDNDGWTPLHAASHWSQEDSAKLLADKNADFRARSKLGQTPFDVADEDMLEYMTELETGQKENVPDIKDEVIEPPPVKTSKLSSRDTPDILKLNEIQNGERGRERKKLEESSSSGEEEEDTPQIDVTSSPRPAEGRTPFSAREKNRNSSLINDYAKLSNEKSQEDTDVGYGSRRVNSRPPLGVSTESPHRPVTIANSDASVTRPVAATQPVQSVTRTTRENGTRSYTKEAREESPSLWRTGLRKTGSFEEKTRPNIQSLQSKMETERSSFSSRFSDESKTENTRLARVAPILDARKTKTETENEDTPSEEVSGYQRGSYSRYGKYGMDVTPATDNDSSVFKRSSIVDTSNDTTPQNDTSSSEKRRSHLQPVRDEEAEARRKARSRRERQSRRSTQGVTLDVVEEAMRTIGKLKRPDKLATEDGTADLSRGDSSTQGTATTTSQPSASSGTPVTSLPSGYIPSDQRVRLNDLTTDSSIPSIKVDGSATEGDNDKGDTPASGESETKETRKSAAQQRRRNRKERRSTGIPDVKPTSGTTENNDAEEEDSSPKEDAVDPNAERLRATAEKYNSSSLPERHSRHRTGVRSSDSDIPSKLTQPPANDTKNYKKLYEENQTENERLRGELSEAQREISELKSRLEKAEDNATRRQALDNEKRERRALERKLAEMEQELQNSESADKLREANEKLKAENTALVRIVEKLGGAVPAVAAAGSLPKERDTPERDPGLSMKNVKPRSVPDLVKLEREANLGGKEAEEEPDSPRSRSSSSSSSMSSGELDARRSSSASLQGTDTFTRTGSLTIRDRGDSPSSSLSSSSTASLRRKARLEASSSSPSLLTRSYSPRRATTTSYSSDRPRSSAYSPSRYRSGMKDSSLSNASSYTIPISSSRKEFLRSLPPSSSVVSKPSSAFRTSTTPYSSSKSSYGSPSSRTRTGFSSTSRSPLSKPTTLSKYTTGMSGLSSSRRPLKY